MLSPIKLLQSCHLRATPLLALPLALLGLWLFPAAPLFANDCSVDRYFVDQDATGNDDGSDWANANPDLQTALDAAVLCPNVTEIWVAEGLYIPGAIADDTFSIRPGLAVYGGFDGTESALGQRDWVSHVTVLSGDVAGNDSVDANGVVTTTSGIVGPNSFHVVTMDGTTTPIVATTRLDGFVVTAGDARNLFADDKRGGGLYCDGQGLGNECSPTIADVIFSGNAAGEFGGAMANLGADRGTSSPLLNNVTFVGNQSQAGGAMVNAGTDLGTSSPVLNDVIFIGNSTLPSGAGGAIFNSGITGTSNPVLNRVSFINNSAPNGNGGAMFNNGNVDGTSSPQLTDVTFTANSARHGGAMVNRCEFAPGSTSSPELNRVTFTDNTATLGNGGAIYNGSTTSNGTCSPVLINVVFFNNFAVNFGSAMYNETPISDTFLPVLINVTFAGNPGTAMVNNINAISTISFTISNTIFYGNDAQIFNMGTVVPLIHNSLLQDSGGSGGGWVGSGIDGGGNIDANPTFVDGANGNLRLRAGSPAIDVGDNSAVPVTVTTDIVGAPRISDGDNDNTDTVDMGAYEFVVHTLNVARSGNGNGAVESVSAAIDCGADCTEEFHFGTVVTLTATPNDDSYFTAWSGACTGTATCTVTMTAATQVTATFALKQYSITVSANVNTAQALVGDTITYTYRITNTGDVTFATVSANQTQIGPMNDFAGELAPGDTRTAIVPYVVQQDDLPGPLASTLTVTGTDSLDVSVTGAAATSVAISGPTSLPPTDQPHQPQQGMPIYLPNLHRE